VTGSIFGVFISHLSKGTKMKLIKEHTLHELELIIVNALESRIKSKEALEELNEEDSILYAEIEQEINDLDTSLVRIDNLIYTCLQYIDT